MVFLASAGLAAATLTCAASAADTTDVKHVLALLIDDYGWANAGWHVKGTSAEAEVRTPTLDALVSEGINLDRNYAYSICAPSRAAVQTGRHPLHVNSNNLDPVNYNPGDNVSGFQGVPRPMTGMAAVLKRAGYSTHFFGKWDCGMATLDHTPRGRGYDTALNYFFHMGNYWTSTFLNADGETDFYPACKRIKPHYRLVDMWITNATYEGPAFGVRGPENTLKCNPSDADLCSNSELCPPYPGYPDAQTPGCRYEDEIFRDALLSAIDAHNVAKPFFAFWAPHAIHTPLQVPKAILDQFSHVEDWRRRRYLAMVYFIDSAIGEVIAKLRAKGMYENMLIVMSSDNGGPVYNDGAPGASNYPLRGGKASQWEGGIRVNGFASGGLIPAKMRGKTLSGLTTVWDWYATLADVAGVDDIRDRKAEAFGLPPVDSISQWAYWTGRTTAPPRRNITVGFNQPSGMIVDKGSDGGMWKLLVGEQAFNLWQGPSFPNSSKYATPKFDCKSGCLFRIDTDPTEHVDIASKNEKVVAELQAMVAEAQKTVFNPARGKPDDQSCVNGMEKYGGFWGPWVTAPLERNSHAEEAELVFT